MKTVREGTSEDERMDVVIKTPPRKETLLHPKRSTNIPANGDIRNIADICTEVTQAARQQSQFY
jgi:hypothetical protein